jgi:ABC-type multidrug transport system fused ATPase/permease subunit
LAVLCVIAISVLWGGGLGLLGPGSKILISDEGLHGWAYQNIISDRFKMSVSLAKVPADTEILPGKSLTPILEVTAISEGGLAHHAGIVVKDWIVGIFDADGTLELVRGDALSGLLALAAPGEPITLRLVNSIDRTHRRVTITPDPPSVISRAFGRIVSLIPEPQDTAERFRIFLGVLILALIVNYTRDVFRFVQEYLVETAIARGIIDMRCEMYNVTLRLPMTHFSEKGTTDTMSRFVKDTNELARGQVTLFGKTIAEPAKAIGAVVVAFIFSWQLTLLAMIAGPPTFILIRKFGKRMKRASRKALEGWAAMLGVLEETLTGIRVVKAYTMEGTERKRFFRANRQLFKQQKKIAKIDAAVAPTVEALGITAASAAAALAGWWVINPGVMEASDFIALMGCLAAMFDPLRKLAKVFPRFQRCDAAAARIFEVQDRQQEKFIPGAPMLPRHSQSIELRNVSFRYPQAVEDALKDINFKVRAGHTVAIVGPNGCGKTTLVSLIPRLIDPVIGEVLIDGNDISQYSIRSVRRQIGLVTQDTVLFNATIGENIAYGLRRPKDQDVLAAAGKAFVDEFVREMPDGYETMVGERGATLSGGQKQRIAIARAILRDPAILIFDEATSQIDADSEQRIHQAMEQFIQDRTALVIAHRFATVRHADLIIVMSAGRILDVGTHDELLERCELYRHLYNTQLGDTTG